MACSSLHPLKGWSLRQTRRGSIGFSAPRWVIATNWKRFGGGWRGRLGGWRTRPDWPSLAQKCLRKGLRCRSSIDCRIFQHYTNQAVKRETKDVLSSHFETASLGFRAPTSDRQTAVGDKGHDGDAPGYLSPADDAVNLLEQTRAFSRAVNQLQADMEQSIGKPTSPARQVV